MVWVIQTNIVVLIYTSALSSPVMCCCCFCFVILRMESLFLTNSLKQIHLLPLYWVSKWKIMHCSISEILMGPLIFWVSVFSEYLNHFGLLWSIQRSASNIEWQWSFPTKEKISRYFKDNSSYLDCRYKNIRIAKLPIWRQIIWETLCPQCQSMW